MTISIILNGESQQTPHLDLLGLVQDLDLEGKRFAVELNEQIIPKSRLGETPISPNDRIEIIHAVGGG